MPHLTYEYTDNLDDQDIQGLVDKSAQVIIDQDGVFPTGGIRVRAVRLDTYAIADGAGKQGGLKGNDLDDAFVHAHLKIGKGRTPEQLQKVCDDLFELMNKHFAEVFEQRGLALSLEYSEFANGTWKKNNLHQRYK